MCHFRSAKRWISGLAGLLVAVSLITLALAWGSLPASAQQCTQPADDGCPIDVNQTVSATLGSPVDINQWRLTPQRAASLHVVLSGLAVDYDLHVYRTNGTLVAESTNEGTQDDSVDIDVSPGDSFVIYVNSARGEVSDTTYTLRIDSVPTQVAAPAPAAPLAPAATPPPTADHVLLADNFDDPRTGWLPVGRNGGGSRAYVDGEYQLAKTDPSTNSYVGTELPGLYSDSTLAFDVRVEDAQPDTGVHVYCRRTNNRGYRAELRPENRTFALSRFDGDVNAAIYLAATQPTNALRRGTSNHIEFSCVGSTISLSVNGTLVGAVQDTTYTSGTHQISSGIFAGKTSDVRLDNLVVMRP